MYKATRRQTLKLALLAALGNPTARALTGLDNRVAIAAEPSARSLAEAVADALSAEA